MKLFTNPSLYANTRINSKIHEVHFTYFNPPEPQVPVRASPDYHSFAYTGILRDDGYLILTRVWDIKKNHPSYYYYLVHVNFQGEVDNMTYLFNSGFENDFRYIQEMISIPSGNLLARYSENYDELSYRYGFLELTDFGEILWEQTYDSIPPIDFYGHRQNAFIRSYNNTLYFVSLVDRDMNLFSIDLRGHITEILNMHRDDYHIRAVELTVSGMIVVESPSDYSYGISYEIQNFIWKYINWIYCYYDQEAKILQKFL